MEHELSAGGPRVDLLGERGEADSARLEVLGQSDEVAEASAQTVQPPHNQRIAVAQRLQAGLELWARRVLAASVLLIDLPTLGALQGIALQIKRLIVGGDARVANPHESTSLYVANQKQGTVCAA